MYFKHGPLTKEFIQSNLIINEDQSTDKLISYANNRNSSLSKTCGV